MIRKFTESVNFFLSLLWLDIRLLLRCFSHRQRDLRQPRPRFRAQLAVEGLEGRIVPDAFVWTGDAGPGDNRWSNSGRQQVEQQG
jgi:hypothetical protein